MQRDVLLAFMLLDIKLGLLLDGGHHSGTLETLPHYLDSQVGGMRHLLVEVAVVAQFIQNNLVGGEIEMTR